MLINKSLDVHKKSNGPICCQLTFAVAKVMTLRHYPLFSQERHRLHRYCYKREDITVKYGLRMMRHLDLQ